MFKNIIKQKELIDREIELYKKEQFLKVDKEIEDYRSSRQFEIQNLAKTCNEDIAKYEHTFHYAKEQKGIELAKLQSKNEALADVIKARQEVISADQNLCDRMDKEVKRLNDIITLLVNYRYPKGNSGF